MTEDAPSAPCPIFFKTHCPNMKKGCQFHHQTEICPQGRACGSKDCHPPKCLLYAKGWCGFIDIQNIPRRYKVCSYFHNGNVPQIPPISTENAQKVGDLKKSATSQDIRKEEEGEEVVETVLLVQRGGASTQENLAPLPVTHLPPQPPTVDSNMNQLKQELGQANEKINKLEQSIKQLQDDLEEDFPPMQGRLNKFEYTVGRLEQRIEEVAKEARKSLEE